MVDTLAAMNEQERQRALQTHWQAAFSDGFIAYVQGQLEAGRKVAASDPSYADFFAELDPSLVAVLKEGALTQVARLVAVWDSMVAVYERLQLQSERQGNAQGMVAHGAHQVMPRGVSVTGAVQCSRCGSPAVDQGLCSGCLATQQDWDQDDLEYDRQLHERQADDLQYQRIQDDQLYYDNQHDYNSYTDYSSPTDYSSEY
jgi:hypothetical protein